MIRHIIRLFFAGWTLRNIYGLIIAGPALYRLGQANTYMAVVVIVSCIAGVALNLLLPLYGWRWLKRRNPQWVS